MARARLNAVREVAIFRNNLFRVSEPFITDQAAQLRRYRPVYVGRFRYGAAPEGARSLALGDPLRALSLPGIVLQMLTRSPDPFRRLLADDRPSLIHAHFGTDGVYALPLARRLNVPLITTFHGFDATLSRAALLSSPAWFNYALFRAQLARQGDLFLCVSEFIRDRVLALGFPPARTHVHYTGVDCDAIQPRGANEATPIILHVARLVEMKGTQYLIQAFAGLAPRHPGARLVIIGDGPLRKSLHALARSLGVGHRIDFLGALAHDVVLMWLRVAAMLVLPSVHTKTGRVEGLGMVVLEAAATGVPVVASCVGGIAEAVVHEQTGLLVAERDVDGLCASIGRLLESPSDRRRMGALSRAYVEQRFDARRQGARLEDFYDAVVASGPR